MSSSSVHAGVVLADSQYEAEFNAYLQRRLTIFYGVTVALAGFLYLFGGVMMITGGGTLRAFFLDPGRLVHLGALALAVVVLLSLRRCPYSSGWLVFLDALGLYVAVGAGTLIYIIDYTYSALSMHAVLALFVIARAVVVPSSAKTTFWLSLPSALGLLAVQLAFGKFYVWPGQAIPDEWFANVVTWYTATMLLSIGVATLASHITFGLQHKIREARKLGQYRLEELVGKGAMGEVYRASHAMLRRPTAIKVIHPDAADPELLARFEREVRQTSRLSHPNTISIYDYGRTPDGTFYYAMEYLDGADLGRIVETSGPMPAARAIHVLLQACGALKEAHEAGLVHRDIKPGNLVLCRRGGEHDVLKVVDFGLVKEIESPLPALTQVGNLCGTPETIAPEVLSGGEVTPAADLYALGVVGYYMLTGKRIFDAESAAELIGHHLHTPPVPLHERRADVPRDLEAVLLRCLEKAPGDRFASAAELRQGLRRCTDSGLWTEKSAALWWEQRAPALAAV